MTNMMRKLHIPFEQVIEKVQAALKDQGFGIITQIDVKETLKKKLNVEYQNYKILGACNPSFAKEALDMEKEVGTLLPCNVIVYESDDGVQISIQKPTEMMRILNNDSLNQLAKKVESKLQKVLDNL
ncbi:DUF302 domain-containing protein [[Eubacterium] cellulosolvens]